MENTPQEPRKGISLHWIYMGIIGLLVAAGIYLFVNKNKAENSNELLTEQVETISTDKASIETDYNAALARLDEMKNESVQMDSLLTEKSNEVEALKIGAFIEEYDIADLKKLIAETTNPDVIAVYSNLLKGSENHLRAFVRTLKIRGVVYSPQILSSTDFAAIIVNGNSTGFGKNRGRNGRN